MAEHYKNLEKSLCKELEKLDKKYTADVEMSEQDAHKADMLYHALKSAATYHAMKDAEEYDEMEGEDEEGYSGESRMRRGGRSYRRSYGGGYDSYARGRDMRTGRYISRDMEPGYSGRYPMEYIDPYWDRRY